MRTLRRAGCLLVLLLLLLPVTVLANSAEPPGLIIITSGLPEDAELSLECAAADPDPYFRTYRVDKLWESYWQFYYHWDLPENSEVILTVTSSHGSFSCPVPREALQGFRNLVTLDYADQTLTLGQLPWRQPLLTTLRITLTLLIEGAIFWLFGFRSKRSWLAFLLTNLVTQGWLNLAVNSYAFHGGYWVILYVGMELGIFLAESVVLPLAIREKRKSRTVVYALTANAVSLLAGIYLIGHMPL